jgi:hypothetical protein
MTKRELATADRVTDREKPKPEGTAPPLAEYVRDAEAVHAYEGKDGTIALFLPPDGWVKDDRAKHAAAEAGFLHRTGECCGAVIMEKAEIPIDRLVQGVLAKMREGASEVKVLKEERRRVNGRTVVCLIVSAKASGQELIFYGYYHSGKSGSLQLVTWVPSTLFSERKVEIEKFLNGLVLIGE